MYNFILLPEFIDPVFTKTGPKRSFSVIQNERFGLVFAKTGSARTFGITFNFGSRSAKAKRSRSDPNPDPDPQHCFSLYLSVTRMVGEVRVG